MKIELDVNEYDPTKGLSVSLDPNAFIATSTLDGEFLIRANRTALIQLASHLLTLAQPKVPAGTHIHYDDLNFLQEHSKEMIIERVE